MAEDEKKEPKLFSRRSFLRGASAAVVGGAASTVVASPLFPASPSVPTAEAATPPEKSADAAPSAPMRVTYPASAGYLVVDPKKCAGCLNCMIACSTAHYGEASFSLARIQISQDPFQRYPNDLQQNQCRQCASPLCVQNCPTGAAHIDTENGNVRVIDEATCVGCKTCLSACPQVPRRTVWNPVTQKSTKCDLCLNTPYWNEQGGPTGKQACVEVCPMKAIQLVNETPSQMENVGYVVNLRKPSVADVFMDVDQAQE